MGVLGLGATTPSPRCDRRQAGSLPTALVLAHLLTADPEPSGPGSIHLCGRFAWLCGHFAWCIAHRGSVTMAHSRRVARRALPSPGVPRAWPAPAARPARPCWSRPAVANYGIQTPGRVVALCHGVVLECSCRRADVRRLLTDARRVRSRLQPIALRCW